MTENRPPIAPPEQLRKALGIYKVMAIASGVALFILLVVMYLRYGRNEPQFSKIWSPIHGAIYFGYAVSIANLGFKAGWPLMRMVTNMLTGFVPFLPFVAEPRVAKDVEALIASREAGR